MSTDSLGARGEALFYVLMTEFHPIGRPIFAPVDLGAKWPTVDFVVELIGNRAVTPYFFVQVKTTRLGYTATDNRLKVSVKRDHVKRLLLYPAPTYLVGIDDQKEVGFIVSANGETSRSLSSMSTDFPIDQVNRQKLWDEVNAYWRRPGQPKLASAFQDQAWR
jgi:hypothetical protein